jgi:hypothetical protein
MDLSAWLVRRLPVRPLIVAAPGGTAVRLAVERFARGWGWRTASSPAEANMLVVAGSIDDDLRPCVDAVWRTVPVPRTKVVIDVAAGVETALATAVDELRDTQRQRSDAVQAADATTHSGHGSGMHGGHGMGDMEMPGGIPMADRADDRDGLKLDVLHVPLGPVLADWPPGLIVRTTLQGDVIQDASVEVVGSGGGYWTEDVLSGCARRLDGCARLLAIAGWEHAASWARRLRDCVLLGHSDVRPDFDRWQRLVRRSRVLRWSLAGLGMLSDEDWKGTSFAGDAADRFARWIDHAGNALALLAGGAPSERDWDDAPAMTQAVIESLPGLLNGCEFAGARLVIASLDPDTDQMHGHG